MRRWSERDVSTALTLGVASVWLVHGLYNKVLHGSPRHLAIVQSVPGLAGSAGEHALVAIGGVEIAVALWVLSGWFPHSRCSGSSARLPHRGWSTTARP